MRFKINCFLCLPLGTYYHSTNNNNVELYVKHNLTKIQSWLCPQLCSGTSPLVIAAGEFNGSQEEEKRCVMCGLGEIKIS